MKKQNIVYAAVIIAIGIFAAFYATQYKTTDPNLKIGADFFPILMSIGLIAMGILILVGALRNKVIPGEESIEPVGLPRLLVFIIAFMVYYLLLKPLGFIVASILMVAYCMFQMGCKKWIAMAIYSVALPSVVFILFYYLMYVNLPLGILSPILPKY